MSDVGVDPGADIALSLRGLDATAVQDRIDRGLVNRDAGAPSRTVPQIVAANVFTRFNAILGGLLAVVIATGDLRDALFGFVVVANSAVGIVQELRAKRALDQLALLHAPEVTALRDGAETFLRIEDVVVDDILVLRSGDQIVADGPLLVADGLEIDESMLTGESDAVAKQPGDELLSGSFVASGTGVMRAARVGAQAYAAELAREAGAFTLVRSELRTGIDRILRLVTWALVPTAVLLVVSQLRVHASVSHSLSAAVAGVVAMVPEGLVLLTSGAFAVAVVRLARRNTLVQQLPAVETLARVDVVCLDKTGTLTEGALSVDVVEPLDDDPEVAAALGALAASDPDPNATMRAIAARYPAPPAWRATGSVPFASARKWGAMAFDGHGAWLLGAPELLLDATHSGVAERVAAHAGAGRRVLLLARTPHLPSTSGRPQDLVPAALVVLTDRLRADAPDTVAYFASQGVALKIISGDDPRTVAAIARQAGVPGAAEGVDARALPPDPEALGAALESGAVFGRVTPAQKREMVAALQARGHVVAMTGDGVNDVLALKRADMGIAMGSGTAAARAVSEVVLLDGSFASLPAVVAEGRRVLGNIERVAKLFVTKSMYSFVLAVAIGIAGLPFPFLPRHLTLVGTLTIGLPGLVLALGPNIQRAQPGFTRRVLTAAVPAGLVAAAATFAAYAVARLQFDVNVAEAQTTATIVLTAVGLLVLARLIQPLTQRRRALLAAMAAAFVAVLVIAPLTRFFALDVPPPLVLLASVGVVAMSGWLLTQAPAVTAWLPRVVAARRLPGAPGTGPAGTAARPPLSALLGRDEDEGLERKATLRWDRRTTAVNRDLERAVAKTVAGFLNSAGGTLLIGVDDEGHVTGLHDDYATLSKPSRDGFRLHLTQILAKYLDSSVMTAIDVRFEDSAGREVCVVDVTPRDEPVFAREGEKTSFYARIGNATRALQVDEAIRYVQSRSGRTS